MNIGICPDECRLFYQVRLPFLTHHIFQRLALNWSRMCFTKWKAVPISSELAWKYLSWSMPHKTLRLRCNISLHKMCYPSRSPTNCPQYFELIFWISEVPKLVVYLIIFDLGFLTKISQIYTQISCFCARVHHHRSCLWCWEPQAWYTSSTTWATQKHCPFHGWFWKKWNYKYVESSDHPLLQVNLLQNKLKYFTRIRGWF